MPLPLVESGTKARETVFGEAKAEFYEVCADVDDAYERAGVDINRVPKAPYWLQVARATTERVNEKYSHIDITERDLSKASALELAGHTPFYIVTIQNLRLSESGHPSARALPEKEKRDMELFRSNYNGLLRDYAEAHLETVTTAQLNADLIEILKKSEITRHPERLARELSIAINGAQTEVLGRQVLDELGRTRSTTPEEDLRGIDQLFTPDPHYLPGIGTSEVAVDYKSSSKGLQYASGSAERHRAVYHRGRLLLNFNFQQEDHNGRFVMSKDKVQKYAREIKPFMELALTNSSTVYTTESS